MKLSCLSIAVAGTMAACGPSTEELLVEIEGLGPAGQGFTYELWLASSTEESVSIGRFDVETENDTRLLSPEDLASDAAQGIFLTLEPATGDDPAPSGITVLAGEFENGVASLYVAHPQALGSDLTNAEGSYILDTPSTAAILDDFNQGIWFHTPGVEPAATMVLPALNSGWTYEEWAVLEGTPHSMGRFDSGTVADSDGAGGSLAGQDPSPAFPGQDFISPPRVVTGGVALVTVEPEPDTSPKPFYVAPLIDDIAALAQGVSQPMLNQAALTNPSATATIR